MPPLERISKSAATVSVLVILALMLAVHPDMTWLLRGLTVAALVAGWFRRRALRRSAGRPPFFWLFVAAIAPALLRLLAGREGPVLDLVWMAGLAGSLLRTTPWSRWAMPFPVDVLTGGWTLTLALSWPVLVAREIGFRLTGFFDTGAINSWSLMSAPQVVSWILYVVWPSCWARCGSNGPARRPGVQSPMVLNGLWTGATIASVVAILQGTIDIGLLSNDSGRVARATGTMLDANAYGMCAALAAPIGCSGCAHWRRTGLPRRVAVFVVNFAGMWLSGSRTRVICGLAGTRRVDGRSVARTADRATCHRPLGTGSPAGSRCWP